MAMMASYNTRPRKLSLPCRTRTFQALILSTAVFLAASTAVVVGKEPQPPSSSGGGCHYRFELTHVDANLNFSSDELMRRAYDRSRLRAASLAAYSDGRHEGRVSIPDASYIITFYLGNQRPEDNISAVVDTGSDIFWTTEKECSRSKTRSMLPCCSPKCEQRASCGCGRSELKAEAEKETKCTYAIIYGGNANDSTAGVMYEDKLTIVAVASKAVPSSQSFKEVAIGCSTSATLKFKDPSIKGVFGLGRSATSLPRQLNFSKFSYCLSSYQKPDLPSYLLLTAAPDMATGAVGGGAAVATTALQPNSDYKTLYFVHLQNISIGGTRFPAVSTKSGGNMFVDTGASFTRLEGTVFAKLVTELDRIMKERKYVKEQPGRNNGQICYSPPSTAADESSKLPDMVLHFADSANMVLPWDSYLWKTTSKLCLAIDKSNIKGGISVLGNFQMQNTHMLLDTGNEKLSFVRADCSKVI